MSKKAKPLYLNVVDVILEEVEEYRGAVAHDGAMAAALAARDIAITVLRAASSAECDAPGWSMCKPPVITMAGLPTAVVGA